MLGRDAIEQLIPHRGAMCLLDRVIEWDGEHVELATATHCASNNPLRSNGRLRSVHLCEYGAQAMAVHGGLVAGTQGRTARPGLLVSLREVKLNIDFVEQLAGELLITARPLHDTATSWQYSFEVRHDGALLAEGRAAIIARAP
jgi:predicted hotdog family 3-hydroxylacyl-ACP dehydratase